VLIREAYIYLTFFKHEEHDSCAALRLAQCR